MKLQIRKYGIKKEICFTCILEDFQFVSALWDGKCYVLCISL